MFLMPGSIRQTQCSFFLVAFSWKFLIQPTWNIFASVCRWVSAVMGWCDDGVMADSCVLFFQRFQPSHLWLSSNEELGCVWLASVHNNGLTSLAALRSPAGSGARATRNVGGSFFSSASLELFSTEQSPEDGQTPKWQDKWGRGFRRTYTWQTSSYYLLLKVSSVLLIHQHQVKKVAYGELLVDVPHGGCQIIPCRRQPMPPSSNTLKQWPATTFKTTNLTNTKLGRGITCQEESDGDGFSFNWSAIHDLVLCNGLRFCGRAGTWAQHICSATRPPEKTHTHSMLAAFYLRYFWFSPIPVISFLMSCSSMCWILILTSRK